MSEIEKLNLQSPDIVADNVAKIRMLFPNVVTEGPDGHAIDFDALRQELSGDIVEGPQERYRLDWPGKRKAMLAANTPISKTLRPVREESVNFDTTQNLFIEGDNLDALKLLQDSYLGKVKMIYIDPPYNTGKDFIYKDNFTQDKDDYLEESGQVDEDGGRLVANTESNGRFHSDWLSMMYPRLKLARNLLRDDGVIVASIDDEEVSSLRNLMTEVFGESNHIATLVWDRNRKNDAKLYSVGHEYMLVFAKSFETLKEDRVVLREEKPGIEVAKKLFQRLADETDSNYGAIEKKWRKHYRSLPKDHIEKPIGRFSKIDEKGPYRDDGNISWPGGGGPTYEVLHPLTGLPCKIPDGGWRYSSEERFWEEVRTGKVVFGEDETTLPRQRRNLFDSDGQVMPSVNFSYAQTATVNFNDLMGARVFENPKNWTDLKRLVKYHCKKNETVLDFFAGSGSTAHGVFEANAESDLELKFVAVQLAEKTDKNSTANRQGFSNIADLSKERICRAGAKVLAENPDQVATLDIGFRVLKIDTSNMLNVSETPDSFQQGDLIGQVAHIKDNRDAEDLLFQVMLVRGLELSQSIVRDDATGQAVFSVGDDNLAACFAHSGDGGAVTTATVKAMAARRPLYAVFRDDGFASDTDKINAAQLFEQLTDDHTRMLVI